MSPMRVPYARLRVEHDRLRPEILAAINAVADQSAFAGGPWVEKFERAYGAYCDVPHVAGVASGTDALWLALQALDIGSGDEVITTPMTFLATAEAISRTGATPVFVDIDPALYTLDPSKVAAAITPRTRAVVPVHLFGQCADLDGILALARKFRLRVVEDAAQSHGARYRGVMSGSIGDAGATSFYPGKNLGAWGEAGAVMTRDASVAGRVRMLRDHGQARKYEHAEIGWNARMDGIQAAILQLKLACLDELNTHRRRIAARYRELLGSQAGIVLPQENPASDHVYHAFVVRVPARDRIASGLRERGIECGIHYPIPVHLQPAYRSLGYEPDRLPVAERCAREFLSLPVFPEMSEEDIDLVAAELNSLVAAHLEPTLPAR